MTIVPLEQLRNVIALNELPDQHLQWILERSEYQELEDGNLIAKFGDPADSMWIILEGKVTFYMNVNGIQVYYYTFDNDQFSGGVGGIMPYSRMKTIPGYSYAVGKVRVLRLHKKYFSELEDLNPDLIQKLIGYMTERARSFATTKLQHEKMNALGVLAAGIAHELNNPASAIQGISDDLSQRLNRNYELTEKLLECAMSPGQIQHIRSLVKQKEEAQAERPKQTALQRMRYEEEIADWLQDQGIVHPEAAETFSDFGFSIPELQSLRDDLGENAFICVIPWLENLISSQRIIKDLANASTRISNLVLSIKSHVHMDRTKDLQPTDIHKGIDTTLALLGFKLREKNIEVVKKYRPDLPEIPAYISELNQVWTNLIDNAIFALGQNGVLTIETALEHKTAIIRIIDNGPGIPQEIISRIFDPFFTTKKVGEGTGIGLDIANRVVKRHNGEIKVNSKPGRTEFSIYLPTQQKETPK